MVNLLSSNICSYHLDWMGYQANRHVVCLYFALDPVYSPVVGLQLYVSCCPVPVLWPMARLQHIAAQTLLLSSCSSDGMSFSSGDFPLLHVAIIAALTSLSTMQDYSPLLLCSLRFVPLPNRPVTNDIT